MLCLAVSPLAKANAQGVSRIAFAEEAPTGEPVEPAPPAPAAPAETTSPAPAPMEVVEPAPPAEQQPAEKPGAQPAAKTPAAAQAVNKPAATPPLKSPPITEGATPLPLVEPQPAADINAGDIDAEKALPEFENGGSFVDDLLPGDVKQDPVLSIGEPAEPPISYRRAAQPGHRFRFGQTPLAHMNMLSAKLYNSIELPRFNHRDPDDPHRFTGAGEPLNGTSWRNRPLHFDLFFGGMFADDLVRRKISQSAGEFGGLRLGADFDHYWGIDFRYAAADLALTKHDSGASLGTSHNQFFDLQLVHYPWGDSKWRPFFAIGLGLANIDGANLSDMLVQIPIGAGLKYFWYPWLALRFDIYNNLTIPGHSIDTVNHGAFTIGIEWRFGGRRKSYYPHHPGKYIY